MVIIGYVILAFALVALGWWLSDVFKCEPLREEILDLRAEVFRLRTLRPVYRGEGSFGHGVG